MKKILGIVLVCMLLFANHVYAKPTNKITAEVRARIQEKRAEIKANNDELKTLRAQLRTKVLAAKALLNQYRDEDAEDLTAEDVDIIKDNITALKQTRVSLGNEYSIIVRALAEYRKDKTTTKLTGLDRVIAFQEQRITMLKEAVAKY